MNEKIGFALEPQGDDINPEDIEDEVFVLDANGKSVALEIPDDTEGDEDDAGDA